ncbi:MAG: FimB/Mfa2 family fimbrial subunit [Muribaculaceae bacterium]|nr:FimB/Mfa2 family fimbrial subunit [Muribaculaceae bacterium]
MEVTGNINMLKGIGVALLSSMMLSSCGLINDYESDCPVQLRVKLVYDYNMKFVDAFQSEVTSVNVWAFDTATGQRVWQASASGEELLMENGFVIETPLEAGSYDFVAWCGLEGNTSFDLSTYEPQSRTDLEVTLNTIESGDLNISDSELSGLYHGEVLEYTFAPVFNQSTIEDVTIPLTKDTNSIKVLLQNMDGAELNSADFSMSITDANSLLAWNNSVLPGPTVTYEPWITSYGVIGDTETPTRAVTTVSALLSEFSMSRLIDGQECWLTVTRHTDGKDIIHIPVIEYLLLIKGHYGNMTDQEYLDRQDDYSMTFILDDSSNWNVSAGIYINSWAVVPPQNEEGI